MMLFRLATRPLTWNSAPARFHHAVMTLPSLHAPKPGGISSLATVLVRNKGIDASEVPKLYVGQTVVVNKAFPFEDVKQFAALSHDTNPLHLNEEYAKGTIFGQRVVHGVFVLGFVSAVLGTQMPGIGTILLSHYVRYPKPTYIGDTVSCMAEVKEIRRRGRVVVHVTCTSLEEGHTVLEGDFKLLVTKDAEKVTDTVLEEAGTGDRVCK